jgi:hypothetical protein
MFSLGAEAVSALAAYRNPLLISFLFLVTRSFLLQVFDLEPVTKFQVQRLCASQRLRTAAALGRQTLSPPLHVKQSFTAALFLSAEDHLSSKSASASEPRGWHCGGAAGGPGLAFGSIW